MLVAAGLALLLSFWDTPLAALKSEEAAAAYRRAGWPWEAKDLASSPSVADFENAAPLLRQAAAALPKGDVPKETIDWARPKPDELSKLATDLAPYTRALTLAHLAASKPRLDFKWDWDLGPALITPEMAPYHALQRVLLLRAELEAARHKVRISLSDLEDAIKLDDLCATEPDWLCFSLAAGGMNATVASAQVAAFCVRGDAVVLAQLQRMVESIRIPRTDGALRGVAYHNLAMLRNLDWFSPSFQNSEVGVSFDPTKVIRPGMPSGWSAQAYATRFYEAWTRAKRAMDSGGGDPARYEREIDRIGTEMYNRRGSSYRLMAILLPIMGGTRPILELKARIAVTDALIEAIRFRGRTGSWPVSLSRLSRAWVDPYTEKPLRYLVRGDAVRIYSLGPDRVDYRGRARSEVTETAPDYDIVAACPPLMRPGPRP